MAKRAIITLLTDFGLSDHYVAAMKGVILGISPEAQLIDISHQIDAFRIEDAAFTLGQAWPCFPPGTIHLVVVDPGVGSSRRALLVEAGRHRFVGPDNGVLTFPMDRDPRHKSREITAVRYFRQPVSRTFHGRDIFAPVAGHLAAGVSPARFGKRVSDPVRLDFGVPVSTGDGKWRGKILRIDHYGNVITSFVWEKFGEIELRPFELRIGTHVVLQFHPNYAVAPVGIPILLRGSSGYYEISINQGDAARHLEAEPGAEMELTFPQVNPGERTGTRPIKSDGF
jgi:S-adenosylmethionine hydrolase